MKPDTSHYDPDSHNRLHTQSFSIVHLANTEKLIQGEREGEIKLCYLKFRFTFLEKLAHFEIPGPTLSLLLFI